MHMSNDESSTAGRQLLNWENEILLLVLLPVTGKNDQP